MKTKYILIPAIVLFLFSLTLWMLQFRAGDELLKRYGISELTLREKIAYLENSVDDREKVTAGVTGTSLIVTLEGKEFQFRLPTDEFYLSVAPYIDQTHPCGIHSLVTCKGELTDTAFDVTVVDENDTVILSGTYTSYANGFIGVWLPKNKTLRITVTYQGLSATSLVTTNLTSNTCLTTLRLS